MKYDIMMSCGHIETVQIYGKADDRERKIRYFENYRTCKECYKQKMRERERKQGLLFHACIDPCVQQMDGDVYLLAWYGGDTITHSDIIGMGDAGGRKLNCRNFRKRLCRLHPLVQKKQKARNRCKCIILKEL